MSFWNKVQQLPFNVLCQVYDDEISLEVRFFLTEWIEYTFAQWSNIDISNASYTSKATATLDDLLAEIGEKIESFGNQEDKFLPKLNLQIAAENFNTKYRNNPLCLIEKIRSCILKERQLLFHIENSPKPESRSCTLQERQLPFNGKNSPKPESRSCILQERQLPFHYENSPTLENRTQDNEDAYPSVEIKSQLEVLRLRTIETTVSLSQLKSNQKPFVQLSSIGNYLIPDIPMEPDFELAKQNTTFSDLQKTFEDTLHKLTVTQNRILDVDLIEWKKERLLAVNESQIQIFIKKLDKIQNLCEMLFDILISTRNQIQEYENYKPQTHNDYLHPRVNELISSLVEKSFIIEKEPPQVLRMDNKFEATVSLLIGRKLNYYSSPTNVCVKFINQKEYQSGDIQNNIGSMKFDESTKRHSITLKMKLKKKERNRSISVTEEKFALLFETKFSIDNGAQEFTLRKYSLPIVVIVNVSQEPRAISTILWDNTFSEKNRVHFHVPMNVPWPKIAEMLNRAFNSTTGKGLTDENLEFIASIAFQRTQNHNFNQNMITWTQFCKDALPGRNFTFWEWFYEIMKITSRKHVRELWIKNAIKGFIDKTKAEDLLKNCSQGTFLLRFSESQIGGITLAWVEDDFSEGYQQKIVKKLKPFNTTTLAFRSLADRIKDFEFLEYLYPNIPKNQVFEEYYSEENYEIDSDPYTFHNLISVVPGYRNSRLPDIEPWMDFDSNFSFPEFP